MRQPPTISTLFPYTTLFPIFRPPCPSLLSHCCPTPKRLANCSGQQHNSKTQQQAAAAAATAAAADRKSTRLNSSHPSTSYAVFCLKNKIHPSLPPTPPPPPNP